MSRDPVDPNEQQPESLNPYQAMYNNPYIYSDPTGMFSITEINATVSLNDALQATRTYAGNQAKEYLKQRIGDAFGQAVSQVFNMFLPTASIGKKFPSLNAGASDLFEISLRDQFCNFAELLPLADNLRIEPAIDASGHPLDGGINCAGGDINDTKKVIGPALPPGRSPNRPDFIFINGNYRLKNPGGYLIGDLKIIQSKAYAAINGNDQRGHRQWQAMAGYARDWQMLPFVSYISLAAAGFGVPTATAADEKKAVREAMNEHVILILANLYGKTS